MSYISGSFSKSIFNIISYWQIVLQSAFVYLQQCKWVLLAPHLHQHLMSMFNFCQMWKGALPCFHFKKHLWIESLFCAPLQSTCTRTMPMLDLVITKWSLITKFYWMLAYLDSFLCYFHHIIPKREGNLFSLLCFFFFFVHLHTKILSDYSGPATKV
jgi:hypothetical protein